jgi:hypothetical protein
VAKKKTLNDVYSKHFRKLVEDGGGQYVGIQEVEGGDDLVLFTSLKTGSTLAVKAGACSAESVAVRLAQHEDKWSHATINV